MLIYDLLQQRLVENKQTFIITALTGPQEGEKTLYDAKGEVVTGPVIPGMDLTKTTPDSIICLNEIEYFVQLAERDPQVLILGAGHVSRAISELLLFIGCGATVVDDRPEYVVPAFFPAEVKRVCVDFHKVESTLSLGMYTGFIVVTRAHEYDSVCLDQLRPYLSVYTGVMGSSKRLYFALEAMRQRGWSEAELEKIYGPIGLDIGSETPEEIALSVVSEYLAVTRGGRSGRSLSVLRKEAERGRIR